MKTWWRTPDGLAVLVAGTLFLIALIWVGLSEGKVSRLSGQALTLSGGDILAANIFATPAEIKPEPWTDPAEGAAADVWVFDVFTPPVIYYDRETGRFSVSAPEVSAPTEESALREPFGLSLVQVVRDRYPLQLIGYAGTESDPMGIFENVMTSDGVVARQGHVFAALGLELRRMVVRREDRIVPDSMPLREIVAVAEIWDRQTSTIQRLTSASSAWLSQPKAQVMLVETGEIHAVEAGNHIETESGVFQITGVFSGPDSVTVVKRLPNGTKESVRLTPDLSTNMQFSGDKGRESP